MLYLVNEGMKKEEKQINKNSYLRGEIDKRYSKNSRIRIKGVIVIFLLMMVIGIELFIIFYGLINFIKERWVINKWDVRVSGCSDNDIEDIRREVDLYLRNRDVFINLGEIKELLERKWRFSRIGIKKDLNGVIFIEINLKEPFIYMISGGGYILDKEGEVIDELMESNSGLLNNAYPIMYIEEGYRNKEIIDNGISIVKEIMKNNIDIVGLKYLRYDGQERSFYIKLEDKILKVSEDNAEEDLRKYFKYKEEVASIISSGSIVDLRFRGQIVIK